MTALQQSPIEQTFDDTVSSDLSWEEQLVFLKGFSQRMGALHDAQVMQLRLWPFAVDPDLPREGQETHVDLENKKLEYAWVDPDRGSDWSPDEAYLARLKTLAKWTKWMLGRFDIKISLNGQTIFVSDRDRPKKKRKKRKRRNGKGRKKR